MKTYSNIIGLHSNTIKAQKPCVSPDSTFVENSKSYLLLFKSLFPKNVVKVYNNNFVADIKVYYGGEYAQRTQKTHFQKIWGGLNGDDDDDDEEEEDNYDDHDDAEEDNYDED